MVKRHVTLPSHDFLDKGKNTWLRFMLMQKRRITKPTHKPIQFEKIAVTNKSKISQLSAGGGYAISIVEIKVII
jgi:hypothetical protein